MQKKVRGWWKMVEDYKCVDMTLCCLNIFLIFWVFRCKGACFSGGRQGGSEQPPSRTCAESVFTEPLTSPQCHTCLGGVLPICPSLHPSRPYLLILTFYFNIVISVLFVTDSMATQSIFFLEISILQVNILMLPFVDNLSTSLKFFKIISR